MYSSPGKLKAQAISCIEHISTLWQADWRFFYLLSLSFRFGVWSSPAKRRPAAEPLVVAIPNHNQQQPLGGKHERNFTTRNWENPNERTATATVLATCADGANCWPFHTLLVGIWLDFISHFPSPHRHSKIKPNRTVPNHTVPSHPPASQQRNVKRQGTRIASKQPAAPSLGT